MKKGALCDPLLMRGEINRVFATNTVDMAVLATQVAVSIAGKTNVLLVDFGTTGEMRRFRYSYESGEPYVFPDTLFFSRAGEPVKGSLRNKELCDIILAELSDDISIDTVIVNNTSSLPYSDNSNDSEDDFILKMITFARKKKYSLLLCSWLRSEEPGNSMTGDIVSRRKKGESSEGVYVFNQKKNRLFDNVYVFGHESNDIIRMRQEYSKDGIYLFGQGKELTFTRDMSRPFPRLFLDYSSTGNEYLV